MKTSKVQAIKIAISGDRKQLIIAVIRNIKLHKPELY